MGAQSVTVLIPLGQTPAVVTETLHSLGRDGISIGSVHLLVTRGARDFCVSPRVGLPLLAARPDKTYTRGPAWIELERRWPAARFRGDLCVEMLARSDGSPLADVVTPDDHRATGSAIYAVVNKLTADGRHPLVSVLAGGGTRSVMSRAVAESLRASRRSSDRYGGELWLKPPLVVCAQRAVVNLSPRLLAALALFIEARAKGCDPLGRDPDHAVAETERLNVFRRIAGGLPPTTPEDAKDWNKTLRVLVTNLARELVEFPDLIPCRIGTRGNGYALADHVHATVREGAATPRRPTA